MFLFGLVTVCQGLVQNYSGLLATRFFLGLAETGMFPGCKVTYLHWMIQLAKMYTYQASTLLVCGTNDPKPSVDSPFSSALLHSLVRLEAYLLVPLAK